MYSRLLDRKPMHARTGAHTIECVMSNSVHCTQ